MSVAKVDTVPIETKNEDLSGGKKDHSAGDNSGGRSEKSEDEFDTSEYSESTKSVRSDTSDDSYGASNRYFKKAKKFVRKQARAFVRNFVDYGPPYADQPFDIELMNVCCNPVMNHMELHNLLNKKLNPNIPDPTDLYDTPIHWCARNAHYLAIKMLHRAGAKWDITNEMGLTPLHLAVMMNFPPTKKNEQIKTVRYLLENGADVNIRDKGGFCPIDHAAANNNALFIQMLLERGAKLMRENHILVAKRHHILRNVHDPECYRLLYTALIKEEEEFYQRKKERDQVEARKAEDEYFKKNLKTLDKLKERKESRRKQEDDNKRIESIKDDQLNKLQQEMEKNLHEKHKLRSEQGVWQKIPNTGNWSYNPYGKNRITSQSIYETNRDIMRGLKEDNEVSRFNKTWKRLTEGGKIELDWKKADPFLLPEEKEAHYASSKLLMAGVMIASREGRSKEELEAEEKRRKQSNDIEYHDENDDALVGEDLESFVSGLKNI